MGEHLQASIPWEKHLAQWIGYKDEQVEQQHGMTQVLSQIHWSQHTQEHRFLSPVLFLSFPLFVTGDNKIVCAAGRPIWFKGFLPKSGIFC